MWADGARTSSISALLAVVLACGCERPVAEQPALPVIVDLAQLRPVAAVRTETERIDLGTEEARPHLIEGWAAAERDDHDYAWGNSDDPIFQVVGLRRESFDGVVREVLGPLDPLDRAAVVEFERDDRN